MKPEPMELDTTPRAPEVEATAIGCLLQYPDCIPLFLKEGGDELFYGEDTLDLWVALREMFSKGLPIDMMTWRQRLMDKKIVDVHGVPIIPEGTTDFIPVRSMVEHSLSILVEKLRLRRLLNGARSIIRTVDENQADPEFITGQVARHITSLEQAIKPQSTEEPWQETVERTEKELEDERAGKIVTMLQSPWPRWDTALGGIRRGMTLVLGARKTGKSSICGHVAKHVAIRLNKKALVFTYETGVGDYIRRLVCNHGNVDSKHLFRASEFPPSKEDQLRISSAFRDIKKAPIRIIKGTGMNGHDIAAECRREKPSFVGIDYLMAMPRLPETNARETTERKIGDNSTFLQQLAYELEVPMFVLQHTAETGDRQGEARFSSQCENDADLTIVVTHDGIMIKSQRNGASGGTIGIKFKPEQYAFTIN